MGYVAAPRGNEYENEAGKINLILARFHDEIWLISQSLKYSEPFSNSNFSMFFFNLALTFLSFILLIASEIFENFFPLVYHRT